MTPSFKVGRGGAATQWHSWSGPELEDEGLAARRNCAHSSFPLIPNGQAKGSADAIQIPLFEAERQLEAHLARQLDHAGSL